MGFTLGNDELILDRSGSLTTSAPVITLYPSFSSTIFADTTGTESTAPIINSSANQ